MSSPRGNKPIDFVALAAALLDRAETLVKQWLPAGYKRGHHWYIGDFFGAAGKSANVNLDTGTWIDNGGTATEKGGDLISLYACIRGMTNAQAARELIEDNGWAASAVLTEPKPKKAKAVEWMPIHPMPDDAPGYQTQWAHFARGVPVMHWEYRDAEGALLGVVCRFNKSDGTKDVQPLSFCQGSNGRREWRYKAFNQPRPLYGLNRLASFVHEPDGLVIVLEGEKKCDALWEALGHKIPVVSWPGGCKTAHLADWRPIAGKRVVCWPDADAQKDKTTGALLGLEQQPGMMAMRKVQSIAADLGCQARIVDVGAPGSRPDGWDAADAVEAGWTRDQLMELLRRHVPVLRAVDDAGDSAPPRKPPAKAEPEPPPEDDRNWRDDLLFSKGQMRECVPNVALVLQHHPAWRGVIGFDEFAQRVVKRKRAPYQSTVVALQGEEWTDVDDTRTAMWFAKTEGIAPSSGQVAEAMEVVARQNPFHPVREYLQGLDPWDGTDRIDHWLADFCGVEDSAYVRKVSRYYLIGMVMRVLEPGVKFDYCLVFEGKQGRFKSSAFRALAGEWFSDNELDLSNKDSLSMIRGKWLHEFQEMGSVARAESARQKSFLSRQVDEFRPSYGRREIKCPRQVVFGGTVNEWQWQKDPTGGRRFWPVETPDSINLKGLIGARDRLFAEAYKLALSGERYWPDREEQEALFDPEQLSREAPEPFLEMIARWLEDKTNDLTEFTMIDVLERALKLDAKGMTKDVTTRAGLALSKLECKRSERVLKGSRYSYRRPDKKAASSDTPARAADEGVPI
ncbi:MAG: VapE domain-containing protein [Burkholderiaceae bacterium]